MNRRGFIGAILGTAAATALPSEIWPFRKIFLPPAPKIITPNEFMVEKGMIIAGDVGFEPGQMIAIYGHFGHPVGAVQITRVDHSKNQIFFEPVLPGVLHVEVEEPFRNLSRS